MKIGFDAKRATQNFTGLGNYSRFIINNMVRYFPENTYELFSPRKVIDKLDNEIIKSKNIDIFVKQTSKPFWRTMGITKDIQNEKIDIYHGLSNELPIGIDQISAKSIVTIHDLIFLRYPEFYPLVDRKIYNAKACYACKVADKIVAVSECTKRDIIEFYNTDPNKIEVVYQGCSSIFKEIVDVETKLATIKKYTLPSKFILSIGSIEDRKNILLIVKALKYLPDVHFVTIGKRRKYTEKVIKYAIENNLSDRVHILNDVPLNDLPAILQSSDVFIYPSKYEGFGIPIIEALYSKVPVIAAIGSCLEEAGGPNSIYVNPYDEKHLAQEIERLLADPQLRELMIREGYKYVTRFSDEACTRSLMKVYEDLYNSNK